MLVAPQPSQGGLSAGRIRHEVANAVSINVGSTPDAAATDSGRHLQSAAMTPSAKLVIPRLRDRHPVRDGLALAGLVTVACSSTATLQAVLAPRHAVMRI